MISRSGASTGDNPPLQQLALPGPEGSNGPAAATSSKPEPSMDLLSFDFDTPETAPTNGSSLALVPVTDPLSASNSNFNAASSPGDLLALVDMYPQNNSAPTTDPSANLMGSQPFGVNAVQPQQQLPPQPGFYANGAAAPNSVANHVATPLDQAAPQLNQPALPWNGQMVPQGMSPQSPTGEYGGNEPTLFTVLFFFASMKKRLDQLPKQCLLLCVSGFQYLIPDLMEQIPFTFFFLIFIWGFI